MNFFRHILIRLSPPSILSHLQPTQLYVPLLSLSQKEKQQNNPPKIKLKNIRQEITKQNKKHTTKPRIPLCAGHLFLRKGLDLECG